MASNTVAEHDATSQEHPSDMAYIKIAILLSIITIVEVAIWYIESLKDVLVPALVILSAVKFYFVVAFFMHLKFDDKKLAWIFGLAMGTATAVFLGLWLMQNYKDVTQFVGYLTAG